MDTHLFNSPFFSLITVNDEQFGVFYHKIREGAVGGLGRGRENDRCLGRVHCPPEVVSPFVY